MGLWLKVNRELAGAWRSARYDVGQHLNRRRMLRLTSAETAEFGPRRHRGLHVAKRPPKRVAAATGVVLLVAGGAAGTYLAVAGSLTALRTSPSQPPVAAPAVPVPSSRVPTSKPLPGKDPTQARPRVRRSTPPQVLAMPAIEAPQAASTLNEPESTPTPTSPASPSASPSTDPNASATAEPSPSVSEPSPKSTSAKRRKWGRHGDEDAASGQSGAGR